MFPGQSVALENEATYLPCFFVRRCALSFCPSTRGPTKLIRSPPATLTAAGLNGKLGASSGPSSYPTPGSRYSKI